MDNKDQPEFSLSRMILDTGLIEGLQIPRGDSQKIGPYCGKPTRSFSSNIVVRYRCAGPLGQITGGSLFGSIT
jgi:hypothetical protein